MHSFIHTVRNPAGFQTYRDAFASGWGMGITLPLHLHRGERRPGDLRLNDGAYSTSQKRLDTY